jgi:SAM-dependent methyltransferase
MAACWKLASGLVSICLFIRATLNALLVLIPQRNYSQWHGEICVPIPSLELIEGSAEAIPLESASVDTVVTTWTLCSIPDADRALRERHRVLRPIGRLLFVEHGRAPEPNVRWWQDHLTPAWKCIGGGCHLNRAIQNLIEDSGFQFDRFETGYMRGPKPLAFMYEGTARPR